MNKYEENVYKNLFEYPTKKIVELELENEKLQQENKQLKKQKDDVVSEIKRVLDIWENKPNEIATLDLEELLRMLGEIE